jgi:leucyl/phenylalanyl-tRNA--protein transferase
MVTKMFTRERLGDFGSLFSERIEAEPVGPCGLRRRRELAFRESARIKARRIVQAGLRALRPKHAGSVPALLNLWLREQLPRAAAPLKSRVATRQGIVDLARDLTPASMMEAYCLGLSPSALLGPVAWTSRKSHDVAKPCDLVMAAETHGAPAEKGWRADFDRDPELVIAGCARPRNARGIMPPRLMHAYAQLFDAGFVHCFAVHDAFGEVIGGGFGVAIGRVFLFEGAFETRKNAALFGLTRLARLLHERDFVLIESAPRTAWLGASAFVATPRQDFLALLTRHQGGDRIGRWRDAMPANAPRALAA